MEIECQTIRHSDNLATCCLPQYLGHSDDLAVYTPVSGTFKCCLPQYLGHSDDLAVYTPVSGTFRCCLPQYLGHSDVVYPSIWDIQMI
jgi:hypothetical protein